MKQLLSVDSRNLLKTLPVFGFARHRNYLKTLLALIVFSFAAVAAQAAVTVDNTSGNKSSSILASTFTVNSLLDNESDGCAVGNCTLREAVDAANGANGADIINFAPNLTGEIT